MYHFFLNKNQANKATPKDEHCSDRSCLRVVSDSVWWESSQTLL